MKLFLYDTTFYLVNKLDDLLNLGSKSYLRYLAGKLCIKCNELADDSPIEPCSCEHCCN